MHELLDGQLTNVLGANHVHEEIQIVSGSDDALDTGTRGVKCDADSGAESTSFQILRTRPGGDAHSSGSPGSTEYPTG